MDAALNTFLLCFGHKLRNPGWKGEAQETLLLPSILSFRHFCPRIQNCRSISGVLLDILHPNSSKPLKKGAYTGSVIEFMNVFFS